MIHSIKGSKMFPSKFEDGYSYCTFDEMITRFPNEVQNTVTINSAWDAATIVLEESKTIPSAAFYDILYQALESGSKTALRKDFVDLYIMCESAKEKLISLL